MSVTTTTRHRVTAAYVTVRVSGSMMPTWNGRPAAWTGFGFYRDALLPENAHPEDVARLLQKGAIEEVEING